MPRQRGISCGEGTRFLTAALDESRGIDQPGKAKRAHAAGEKLRPELVLRKGEQAEREHAHDQRKISAPRHTAARHPAQPFDNGRIHRAACERLVEEYPRLRRTAVFPGAVPDDFVAQPVENIPLDVVTALLHLVLISLRILEKRYQRANEPRFSYPPRTQKPKTELPRGRAQ